MQHPCDEDDALFSHLIGAYRFLFTDAELRATEVIGNWGIPPESGFWLRYRRLEAQPGVAELLREGDDAFVRRTVRRLLHEHGDHVAFPRCPACGRVVRTWQTRLCLRCHHSWYHVPR